MLLCSYNHPRIFIKIAGDICNPNNGCWFLLNNNQSYWCSLHALYNLCFLFSFISHSICWSAGTCVWVFPLVLTKHAKYFIIYSNFFLSNLVMSWSIKYTETQCCWQDSFPQYQDTRIQIQYQDFVECFQDNTKTDTPILFMFTASCKTDLSYWSKIIQCGI